MQCEVNMASHFFISTLPEPRQPEINPMGKWSEKLNNSFV